MPNKMPNIQTLEPAMQVFWQHGYEGTNFNQLVDATGLSRKAIYKNWHDKRGLYTQCLELYSQKMTTQMLAPLLAVKCTGLPALQNFFGTFHNLLASDEPMLGCLVIKTINELGTDTAEIAQITHAFLQSVKQGLLNALTIAQAKGQIKPTANIPQAVEFLFAIHCSIGGVSNNALARPLLLTMVKQVEPYLTHLATDF